MPPFYDEISSFLGERPLSQPIVVSAGLSIQAAEEMESYDDGDATSVASTSTADAGPSTSAVHGTEAMPMASVEAVYADGGSSVKSGKKRVKRLRPPSMAMKVEAVRKEF